MQRPLWASTGVKNPAYRDVMYVEELVGPNTVNTMPMATLLAAGDHAEIRGNTAGEDPAPVLKALADAGIDMVDVTDQLLREGVEKFVEPMEKLLEGIDTKRQAIVTQRPSSIDASLPDDVEPRPSPPASSRPRRRTSHGASGARTTRSGARRARPRSPTASGG